MIQELKVKNFFSFKDEVTLSFQASKDKFAQDSQVFELNNKTRLLRYAIIYGYNASGKSNILKVFDFLSSFWNNKSVDMDDKTGVVPFRLDRESKNQPSRFELIFFVEDKKYNYILELDEHQVNLEKLTYYPGSQPVLLFERTNRDGKSLIRFNNSSAKADKIDEVTAVAISSKCLKNISFFVARNQVNANMPVIDSAKDWLRKKILPTVLPGSSLSDFAKKLTRKDPNFILYILNFLKEADFNITHVNTEVEEKEIPEEALQLFLDLDSIPDEAKANIKKDRNIKRLITYFEHTVENQYGLESYNFLKSDESLGTLRVFGLEAVLYHVMKINGFVPIDEIETSLHPKLLEMVLYYYLKTESRSQILVATHQDGLLDLTDDLIRKDAVWFAEKKKNGSTDLYKLTDFKGVNRLTSLREAYRNRRFGATL